MRISAYAPSLHFLLASCQSTARSLLLSAVVAHHGMDHVIEAPCCVAVLDVCCAALNAVKVGILLVCHGPETMIWQSGV
jgi:hypothetical protein